jgi:hypothetical protein
MPNCIGPRHVDVLGQVCTGTGIARDTPTGGSLHLEVLDGDDDFVYESCRSMHGYIILLIQVVSQ